MLIKYNNYLCVVQYNRYWFQIEFSKNKLMYFRIYNSDEQFFIVFYLNKIKYIIKPTKLIKDDQFLLIQIVEDIRINFISDKYENFICFIQRFIYDKLSCNYI